MNNRHSERYTLLTPSSCDGKRLDQAVAAQLPQYSRSTVKQWIDAGQVTLNRAIAKPRTAVRTGDLITVEAILEASSGLTAQAVDFELAYQDDAVIVINKPAGLVVHPGAGNPDLTLVNGLLADFPELVALPRAGLVHRIDKNTSGLLLCARTPQAYQQLVRAMAAREISRRYQAIVTGVVIAGGTIDQAIARDPRQRTRMSVSAGGRNAVTHYRVAARYRAHTRLAVELETGRTHQIRVHFAWTGHPLVGDHRYGARPRPPAGANEELTSLLQHFPRQALHAETLSFAHPASGEEIRLSAPIPSDLQALIDSLADDAVEQAADP